MLSGTEVLIASGFIIALTLMSAIDIALLNANKVSVRCLVDGPRGKAASALTMLLDTRIEVLTSVHIVIQLLTVSGTVLLFAVLQRIPIPYTVSIAAAVVLMMLVIIIFRHLIPRIITQRNPEAFLVYLFPIVRAVHFTLNPVSRLLVSGVNYFYRTEEGTEPEKEEEASEEEIQAFIDAGQEEGILEQDEGEMIQSIVQFGDKVARDVMTPRTQIVAIDISSPVEKLLQLVIAKRHAQIPVYRDDLDNIEGIVHERDLLRVWQRADKLENFRSIIKPAYFVPETKAVDDLLQEMKQKSNQMVLVIDEYGGVSGLITMEDLIEEIVGEIYDESEGDRQKIVEESNGTFIVSGTLELGVLEDKMGLPLVADTDCTTVAGAVIELFGRVPAAGETIEHGGVEIQVLEADRRRVRRLRIKPLVPRRMTF
jgi:CBS domain containing-hemolysin-like protein